MGVSCGQTNVANPGNRRRSDISDDLPTSKQEIIHGLQF